MKTIILVVLLCLSFTASAITTNALRHEVRCIEGYKYLFSWKEATFISKQVVPFTPVQMFQLDARQKYKVSVPINCKEK